jgi:hypothetical protein
LDRNLEQQHIETPLNRQLTGTAISSQENIFNVANKMKSSIDRIFVSFIVADLLFAASSVLLGAVSLIWLKDMGSLPTKNNVARDLLLSKTPLDGMLLLLPLQNQNIDY